MPTEAGARAIVDRLIEGWILISPEDGTAKNAPSIKSNATKELCRIWLTRFVVAKQLPDFTEKFNSELLSFEF